MPSPLAPPIRAIGIPTALAAALAAVYLAISPESQDLAAATFRADLFTEHGFVLWNNQWYSGHHLLSYSVLYPPLAAFLGVRVLGALAVVAAAAIFAALAHARFGERALIPSVWFAAGAASWLLTGRVPFLLAVPFGLAAVWAIDRDRSVIAALLALLATLASPVAGLFVGLAGLALALAGEWKRGLVLALAAGVPMLALNLAFPVGGEEPFVFSAFIALPLFALAVLWLVPTEHRALRIGTVLYALLALAVFVIPNPLGGNVTRLGALLAGPVLALILWPRGRWVVLAVSVPLLYWQLIAPVRDIRKAAGDESTERAYYEPLLAELDRIGDQRGATRVEVPPTKNRWEAAYVAPEHPIARGWLRQLEHEDFDLFTDGNLTAEAYEAWLRDHAVGYVAVADAELDYLAEDEVALIDSGLEYLNPIWSGEDWELYAVRDRAPLGATVTAPDTFSVSGVGEHAVAIEYSRYFEVTEGEGTVSEGEGGRTVVESESDRVVVEARLP